MRLVDISVARPVSVSAGVILLVLFGVQALRRIPIELTPEVIKPVVTVTTRWLGASPTEVEKEIVVEQEEQLKGVKGLTRLTSSSTDSQATVTLEFPAGTDMDAAVVEVGTRLDQVPEAPADADEPVIRTVDPSANAMAWLVVKPLPGNDRDIQTYRNFIEDFVKARFERVPGVALSNVFGGIEREIQVVVHPDELNARGVTLRELGEALDRENVNISAGDLDEGKRRYVVRTLGEYRSMADIESVVVREDTQGRTYVRDVASVRLGHAEPDGLVRQKGVPTIAVNVIQASSSNALDVMVGIREAAAELNAGVLAANGLWMEQIYDQTVYIDSALGLVRQNIFIGGALAVLILLLFLRRLQPTVIVALAIPISVLGGILGMALLGRTVNVISLAGMAFAVGMVVDNAVVVLENIDRHRRMGKGAADAARAATAEVWGAVLASSLTTIAVFLPVIFVEEQAGQLFRDLAVAVCCAVGVSLVVSITVIPAAAAQLTRRRTQSPHGDGGGRAETSPSSFAWVADGIAAVVAWTCRGTLRRLVLAGTLTGLAILGVLTLLPKAEYLPQGNRNLVFGVLLPPPGYNLTEVVRIGETLEASLRPHWEDGGAAPRVDNFFFVARGRQLFLGASAADPTRAADLIPVVRRPLGDVPGLIPIVQQSSLFARGAAQGRAIDIEFTGPDLRHLISLGGRAFGQVTSMFPGAQARPIPSLDLGNPEIHVIPDRERAAQVGISALELGRALDVLLDGATVSEYLLDGQEVDLKLVGWPSKVTRTEDFENLRILTPRAGLVTIGAVADVVMTTGPEEIQHVERDRSITVRLVPPAQVPLEEAMERVESEILGPMLADGSLEPPHSARLSGTADDLELTLAALRGNFVLALAISFLLMAALFESFLHPLVIMFSVPLATVGGILGLRAVNLLAFQPMDVLTMLGFVILVGIVVNNAILIVHQALNLIRSGMPDDEAIRESVRTRVRPIFMTVGTSVSGMLPLVLMPGAGSELYRGLGSVVVGGLVVSTVFTLFLIPALFSLTLQAKRTLAGRHDG